MIRGEKIHLRLVREEYLSSLPDLLNDVQAVGEFWPIHLLDLEGQPSVHVQSVRSAMTECGFHVELSAVPYEFQLGGNTMMRAATRPGKRPQADPAS